MERRTKLLLILPLVLGGLLLGVGIHFRSREDGEASQAPKLVSSPREDRKEGARAEVASYVSPGRSLRPRLSPEASVARATEQARLRSTYDNYRTALATENGALSKALYAVLIRDRKEALDFAESDLRTAVTEFERDIAQRAVEALRRER